MTFRGSFSIPGAARQSRLAPGRWATWPTVIYLVITTQIPFLATLYFSFHAWNLMYPSRPLNFVGFNNYAYVFSDPLFRVAIANTVFFTVASAIATTVLGLGLAVLVNNLRHGRGLAYTLFFAPFLIMGTVNPIIWKTLFLNPIYGLVNFALTSMGLPAIDLISSLPRAAILLMIVWQWTPFMMLILLAGMQSVSDETIEAAKIDGASTWNQFLHVTLPHLVPYFTVGMLVEAILIIPVFGPIYVGTYGGPGDATSNLMFAVYRMLAEQHDIGRAAAGGIVTAIMTGIVAFALLAYIRPYMERQ